MQKKQIAKFKELLEERKQELMQTADTIREEGLGVVQEDLPDEVDQASTEAEQSMTLRLRDREMTLFKKINKALEKITNGDFGICESCGEEIDLKRLEARPVAELCVRCKEEQEKREMGFAD